MVDAILTSSFDEDLRRSQRESTGGAWWLSPLSLPDLSRLFRSYFLPSKCREGKISNLLFKISVIINIIFIYFILYYK